MSKLKTLPASYLDHPLKGEWKGFRDAHIEPDSLRIKKFSTYRQRLRQIWKKKILII